MHKPCSKEINFVRCLKCKKIFQCSRHDTARLLEHIRTDHPEIHLDHRSKSKSHNKMFSSDADTRSATNTSKINCNQEPYTDDVECQYGCNDVRHELGSGCQEEQDQESCNDIKPPLAKDIDLTQYSITSDLIDKYPEIQECEYCPEDSQANRTHKHRHKKKSHRATSNSTMNSPQKRFLYRTSIEKWRPASGTIYCPKCCCNKRPLIKTRSERISSNQCGACCLLSCWPFCFLPCLLPGQNIEYLHCSKCKNFLGLYDRQTNCIKPNRLFVNDEQPCHDKGTGDRNINWDISSHPENESQQQLSIVIDDKCNCTVDGNIQSMDMPTHRESDSKRLPSVFIDGKELPQETVARLEKYKKFGRLAGFDLDEYTDKASSNVPNANDSFRDTQKAPSVENKRRENIKAYA